MLKTINTFQGLTNDIDFKYLFSKEEILKDFVNSFLEYNKINKRVTIKSITPQKWIQSEKHFQKQYYGDIVMVLDEDEIISLEMYKEFNQVKFKKSLSYISRLYGNQLEMGQNYESLKKVCGISLIEGKYQNNQLINKYIFGKNEVKKIIDCEELELYVVNLEKIDKNNKESYNENEEQRFIKWLRLIKARSIEEMKEIGKDDKKMEEAIRYIENWYRESDRTGLKRMLDEAEYNGIEFGSNKRNKEVAKNMLADDLDINIISKYTGLSKKEIEALK